MIKPHQIYRGKAYVSAKEYARMLNKNYSAIKKKLRAGHIPCIKAEGGYLIREDEPYIDLRRYDARMKNKKSRTA